MIENEAFQTVTATNIVVIGNEAFEIVIARSPDCFTLLSATHFADPKGSQLYILTHKVPKVLRVLKDKVGKKKFKCFFLPKAD